MKKCLLLAAALFMGTICFTSCGDDDDEDKKPNFEQLYQKLQNFEIKPIATLTEESDRLILLIEYPDACSEKYVATFNDKDICTSSIIYYDFKYKELCDMFWDHVMSDPSLSDAEKAKYKRIGDTTYTQETQVIPQSRKTYRTMYQSMADHFNSSHP